MPARLWRKDAVQHKTLRVFKVFGESLPGLPGRDAEASLHRRAAVPRSVFIIEFLGALGLGI